MSLLGVFLFDILTILDLLIDYLKVLEFLELALLLSLKLLDLLFFLQVLLVGLVFKDALELLWDEVLESLNEFLTPHGASPPLAILDVGSKLFVEFVLEVLHVLDCVFSGEAIQTLAQPSLALLPTDVLVLLEDIDHHLINCLLKSL